MSKIPDQRAFYQELEQRLGELMTGFRTLHEALGKAEAVSHGQTFFRQLFELQAYFQRTYPQLLKQPQRHSGDREKHFECLYRAGLVLNAELDERALLELALDTLLEMTCAKRGFIASVDGEGQPSWRVARQIGGGSLPEPLNQVSRSVLERAVRLRREVQLGGETKPARDETLLQQSSLMQREGDGLICVPIWQEDVIRGLIYIDQFASANLPTVFNLAKHFSLQMAGLLRNVDAFQAMKVNRDQLLADLRARYKFDGMIGRDKAFTDLLKMIAKVAPTDASVLIQGETGVGKDLVARALHENSRRTLGPLIEIDCGALPAHLIESTLFGHRRGSFTGALQDQEGLLEAAHGGTLFLDEIGNLPLESQVKLLRVLQQRSLRRLGETKERPVDFRLIAANGKSLKELVAEGRFREDLFYRIQTLALVVPPLRERREDIVLLTQYFVAKYAVMYQKETPLVSPTVIQILEDHNWPGNIRELEHLIERAVILHEGDRISVQDLPADLRGEHTLEENAEPLSLEAYVNRAKKYYITKVLEQHSGKKVTTAKHLQINRSYLFQLMKSLGIES